MPFDFYDPLQLLGGNPDPVPQQQPALMPGQRAVPLLAPQEEESLLSQVTGKALGGLGYVGSTLDKLTGGRAIRGLLGGRPQDLLSLLPGSDVLGLTDPSQAVSGEDLLKQWGVLEGEGEKGTFEMRDLAGPALEAVLSPATYLGFGGSALTGAGKAAKAAGTLEKTLAGRIGAGQAGLAALHVPFTDAATTLGTGPTAQKFASGLGSAVDKLSYGTLPGRALGALFDARRESALTEPLQRAAVGANEARVGAEAAARQRVYGWGQRLADAGLLGESVHEGFPLSGSDLLRGTLEGTVSPLPNTEAGQVLGGVGGEMRNYLNDIRQQESRLGMPTKELADDLIDYATRQKTTLAKETPGYSNRGARPLSTWHPNLEAREDILRNIPGGTNQINSWFDQGFFTTKDPATGALRDMTGGERSALLRQELGLDDSRLAALQQAAQQRGLTSAEEQELAKLSGQSTQADKLSKWILDQDPQYAQKGIDFFGNHILEDVMTRGVRSARSQSRAGAIQEALATAAKDPVAAGPGSKSVLDVLREAGLGQDLTQEAAKGGTLNTSMLDRLGINLPGLSGQDKLALLANTHVPAEVARDMTRYVAGFSRPEVLEPWFRAFDSMTMLTKAGTTAVWPAKYVRDFTQSAFMNFVKDARDPHFGVLDPRSWWKPYEYAKTVFRDGGTLDASVTSRIPGLETLAPEEATKALAQEAASFKIMEGTRSRDLGLSGQAPGSKTFALPGAKQESFSEFLGGFRPDRTQTENVLGIQTPSSTLPWNIGGVGGSNETQFWLAKQGGKAMSWIDDMNRGAAYISKRLQGFSPEAAANAVFEAHYDYSNISQFERSVMKRAMPFYCVPDDALALTRDGWKSCDELTVGEEMLTYDIARDCLVWQPCLEVAVFPHDQDLLVLETKRHRLRFTEEHRWPVRVSGTTLHHPYGTYNYPEKRAVIKGRDLKNHHSLIVTAKADDQPSLLTTNEARLLGWLVTDGSWRSRPSRSRGSTGPRNTQAVIYQSPKKFLDEVKRVAGGRPHAPNRKTGVVAVPVLRQRLLPLLPYLNKDRLISVITRLSREAAEAMYDAMYKAEGLTYEGRKSTHFGQYHPGVRSAFRVLAFLLGKRTSESDKGCYVSERRYLQVKKAPRREHYHGRVWCPRTANGTWVMLQNKFVTITGNTWMRQNIPATVKELAQNPGGKMAQAIRVTNDLRDQQGFVPDYVGEGLAIPVGKEDNGTQRFLSDLGLSYEDAFSDLAVGPKGGQRTLQNILSETNPLFKGPLEYATGKQFYSGRDLEDLSSRGLTGNILMDQAIMNSPVSRLATTTRTLFDERKGMLAKALNLATPLKLHDVDMEKARSIAGREVVEDMLKGSPNVRSFERIYVPDQLLGNLTPDQYKLLQLYNTIEDKKKKRS